jgi:probable phosphoglycerate mutase
VSSFTAYVDGGARGNPGPAGWGVQVRDEANEVVHEFHGAIPHATNNVAEYQGLIAALSWCQEHGATRVDIRSDSLLLVQQMLGNFKVKNVGLKPLCAQARLLAAKIGRVGYQHIPREDNKDADRLANTAMDEAQIKSSSP